MEKIKCAICGIEVERKSFNQKYCKECKRQLNNAVSRRYWAKNKDEINEFRRKPKRIAKCKVCNKEFEHPRKLYCSKACYLIAANERRKANNVNSWKKYKLRIDVVGRKATKKGKWDKEELNYLKRNYKNMTIIELAKALKRTYHSVQTKAAKLKLKKDYFDEDVKAKRALLKAKGLL